MVDCSHGYWTRLVENTNASCASQFEKFPKQLRPNVFILTLPAIHRPRMQVAIRGLQLYKISQRIGGRRVAAAAATTTATYNSVQFHVFKQVVASRCSHVIKHQHRHLINGKGNQTMSVQGELAKITRRVFNVDNGVAGEHILVEGAYVGVRLDGAPGRTEAQFSMHQLMHNVLRLRFRWSAEVSWFHCYNCRRTGYLLQYGYVFRFNIFTIISILLFALYS